MSFIGRMFGRGEAGEAPAASLPARIEPTISANAVAAESWSSSTPPAWWGDQVWGGSSRVKSLPPVSPDIAQRHATVFACCNVVAGDLSKVPLKLYQRDADGQEHRVREHPLAFLMNVEAAPGIPATITRFALAYSYLLRGIAYGYAPRDGSGEVEFVEHIPFGHVSTWRAGRDRVYDFEDNAGTRRHVLSRQMVHLRYMAEDGWTGRSPLSVAAESVGLALAGQEAAAKAASGTQVRGMLKMKGYYEDDETAKRNARRLRNALDDPENNGLPIITEDDDFVDLNMSAADQQLLESRKFDREQIAAIYRVPPSKLQMLEHGVKANGQQQAIDYKADCLLHWGTFAETGLAQCLLTKAERRSGLFLRHDYDALLQATTKERYDALSKAIGGPWKSPNEGRADDGLPPIAGGDALYPPPNMTDKSGAKTKESDNAD